MKFIKSRNRFLVEAKIKDVILPRQAKEVSSYWGEKFLDYDEVDPTTKIIQGKWKLSEEDKEFCKDIILSNISNLLSDDYDYQISDGVEASIHAIPALINEYPKEIEDFTSVMVLALLDETSIGQYKRICDFCQNSA